MKLFIEVNLQHEALHCWPQAREMLPEMGFLSDPHRHQFHIRLRKQVNHTERDVEIIMFKRQVQAYLHGRYGMDFGSMSCEQIGIELLNQFECEEVQVMEDGENGAVVKK